MRLLNSTVSWRALLVTSLCCVLTISLADDQYCMNIATKQVSVGITDDNPQKILTFMRDDPGYAKNLQCRWELRASDYNRPRQMLLNVKNVDFDTNNSDQCNSSAVDVFSFTFSGDSNETQVKEQKWCKKSQIPVTKKLILGNLWDSSNQLIVEFKSDDNQVRSNAQGVEMDVVIMSENFCHRDLLFHSGSCYLITEDKLNFKEAYELSKSLLGNLATFPNKESVNQFIKSNTDRNEFYPFRPALKLDQKLLTGLYFNGGNGKLEYRNRSSNCRMVNSTLNPPPNCTHGSRIAIRISYSNEPILTCEKAESRLPALIEFSQIPATIGDRHPQLFTTCPLTCQPTTPPSTPVATSTTRVQGYSACPGPAIPGGKSCSCSCSCTCP